MLADHPLLHISISSSRIALGDTSLPVPQWWAGTPGKHYARQPCRCRPCHGSIVCCPIRPPPAWRCPARCRRETDDGIGVALGGGVKSLLIGLEGRFLVDASKTTRLIPPCSSFDRNGSNNGATGAAVTASGRVSPWSESLQQTGGRCLHRTPIAAAVA